ncbi:type III pantothenate kinase [uncultured Ruminococcus sp.]|uniref:type III pantothenate kinase n=1 Tax=uncultured Ruminococcus sp. TaxID=165186 RepID=UPI0025EB83BC|nr:type III pantothenate kinase [uncultured Ruminococcus sp.]
MILAIDIGNTNVVLGCFDGEKILFRERVSTNQTATDLEYAANMKMAMEMHGIKPKDIDGAIISSVVPSVTNMFRTAVQKYLGVEVKVVGPGIKTGLSILIDNPAQLGSDLVVDAVAGINEYPAPMIIIDMGTATTLSVIDSNRSYLGGMIMTGMAVSTDALIMRTAQLPKIAFEKPKKVIGTNTVDCMKSGIMYSNACAIDGLVERIEEELGEKCTVIATGGLAGVITPLCKRDIILDDDLLLKGLMIIYNKNK